MSAAASDIPYHAQDFASLHEPQDGHDDFTNNTTGDVRAGYGSNKRSDRNGVQTWPHIKDLEARAKQRINPHQPIRSLLEAAQLSSRQADILADFRKPDTAYVEYLLAQILVAKIIPHHKDYPEIQSRPGSLHRAWKLLVKTVDSQHERFDSIRQIIIQQNTRDGFMPSTFSSSSLPVTQTRLPAPSPERGFNRHPNDRPLSVNGIPYNIASNDTSTVVPIHPRSLTPEPASGHSIPMSLHSSPKQKPPVHPKPNNLQSRPLSGFQEQIGGANAPGASRGVATDALGERFARLRVAAATPRQVESPASNLQHLRPLSRAAEASSTTGLNGTAASSSNHLTNGPSLDSLESAAASASIPPADQLYAPLDILSARSGPHPPLNVSLDNKFAAAMPKPPSPTYSPARNMPTPASINPPRSTARSIVGSGGRSNSTVASSVSSRPPGADVQVNSCFPKTANGPHPGPPPRRKSLHLPSETVISAEKLYDYNKMFNVLLIDVRSREEFDQGHIFSQSVMCIEPAALRRDMSADELQDSLVLSPDEEQAMFDRRDTFDLVVYYDQATMSDYYLRFAARSGTEQSLKSLHDALYEFNQDKPLQRPPILLSGGLEAWADLVGPQALATSTTVTRISERNSKLGRPVARVPIDSSRLYLQKRRMRDYNPLDAEEERKWLERARSESVSISQPTLDEEENEAAQMANATPIIRDYDDFYRRFPEASIVEQQSMVAPPSRPPSRPPPSAPFPPPSRMPPQMPSYPSSTVLSVPSRPLPALSRPSYSGVTEVTSQSLPSSRLTTHLPPYIPPKYIPRDIRLPRTGLINFGATCYMNGTIQCLSATTAMSMFFLDDGFRVYVQKDNWKGSKGIMPELYSNLVRELWKADVSAVRPKSLRIFCARLNSEWGLDRQQDAKEYFDFLVDCLHEDLNSNWSRSPLRALTAEEEARRERMPKLIVASKEWERYTHREQSYITDLFAGQHASSLRCLTCGHSSTTYEAFYSISVEIPQSGTGDIRRCLEHYCREERLSGDEVWKCPHCNKEREATKRITITRAPQHLVVHFKRFSASRTQSARKIRTPIDFPLRGLDLEPYMLPRPTPEQARAIADGYGPEKLKVDYSMTPPYYYDAYAVMRHLGTSMTSGHYISLVKDSARGCWRQFNDERVSDFEPDRLGERDKLQNEQAYIVFFQRRPGS